MYTITAVRKRPKGGGEEGWAKEWESFSNSGKRGRNKIDFPNRFHVVCAYIRVCACDRVCIHMASRYLFISTFLAGLLNYADSTSRLVITKLAASHTNEKKTQAQAHVHIHMLATWHGQMFA